MFKSQQLHLQCINCFLHKRHEYNQSHNIGGKIQRSPSFSDHFKEHDGCHYITTNVIITNNHNVCQDLQHLDIKFIVFVFPLFSQYKQLQCHAFVF